jgi:hypothetical protein
MKPYRPAGKAKEISAGITARVVEMRNERQLSWAQIAQHLDLSRAAVWQRYQREKRT